MLGLKAVVFDKEQQLEVDREAKSVSKRRKNASSVKNKLPACYKRDDENHLDSDESRKNKMVYSSLAAKAEIYDRLKEGNEKIISGSFLVDFGRNNRASTDATESNEQKAIRRDGFSDHGTATSGAVSNVHNSWMWSRGNEDLNTRSDIESDTCTPDVSRISQDIIAKQIENEVIRSRSSDLNNNNAAPPSLISSQSRVKSQWEKVLSGRTKEHLLLIHENVEKSQKRTHLSDATIDLTSFSASSLDIQTNKGDRRELLRLKRMKVSSNL